MKKHLVVLSALVFAVALQAHPPKDILFTFDLNQKSVKLDIVHPVKNPVDHFIYDIEVKINGKKAVTQIARAQTGEATQSVVYVIPELRAGDKIEVYAECNKIGALKKEAIVKP
jgi:desulfoferrodoxin (superoxide reductase-like protein)